MRDVLPLEDLRATLDLPLRTLNLPSGAPIALSAGEQWTYFFFNDSPVWEDGNPLTSHDPVSLK